MVSFSANEVMTQTDWSGGASGTNAIHPANKTGWNNYSSQDANINTTQAGKVTLSPVSTGITETTDTDFNAGVYSHTEVTGTGASAGVKLTSTTQDPFNTNLGSWQMPKQLPSGVGAGGALCYPGTGDFVYAIKGHYSREFLKYSVSLKRWYHLANLPKTVGAGADLAHYNGYVYCLQGNGWQGFWRYSIAAGTWEVLSATPEKADYGGKLVYAFWNGNPSIFAVKGADTLTFWAYNISTNQWASGPALPTGARAGTGLTWDTGNYIYYKKGEYDWGFYRLNLTTNTWTTLANAPLVTSSGSCLLYPGSGDNIYLSQGGTSKTGWNYSISGNTWSEVAHSPGDMISGASIVYNPNNLTFYAWGGGLGDNWYPELWEYNSATTKWTPVSYTLDNIQAGGSLCFDGTEYVYALGGNYGYSGARARKFYRYAAATNIWTQLADAPNDIDLGGSVAYAGGYVYAFRGGTSTEFWRYNVSTNTWENRASAPAGGVYSGGALVYPGTGDYIYALAGGLTNKFWRYTISIDTWEALAVAPQNIGIGADLVYYSPGTGDYIYCFAGNNTGYFLRYSVAGNTWVTLTNCPQNATWGGNLAYPGTGDSIYATVGGERPYLLKFSISGNTWEYLEPMPFYRRVENGSALVYGGNNYLYATRGYYGRDFGRYSITTGKWDMPAVVVSSAYKGAVLVKAGNYLYGLQGHYTKGFSRYSLTNNSWEYLAPIPKPAGDGAALAYTGGDYIYALAGSYQKDFYRYTISTDTWTALSQVSNSISQGGSLVWNGVDYLYALRGESQDFYRYTISTDTWDVRAFTPSTVNYGSVLLACTSADYIYSLRGTGTDFWRYNINTNMWNTMASTPDGVEEGSSIIYPGSGDYIYCMQGSYANTRTTGFWRYSISQNTWGKLALTPVGIYYGSAIAGSGNFIYVMPGNYYGSWDLFSYSISDNIWTAASDGKYTGWGGGITTDNTYIYVLEGDDSPWFYRYTPATNSWDSLRVLPANARGGAAICYVKGSGYIYVLRGDGSTDFYRYSISSNSWQSLASVSAVPLNGASLCYPGTGDYIYALRGDGTAEAWKYSISNNTWQAIASAPGNIESGGCLVSDGADYIYTMRGYSGTEFYRYSISGNSWSSMADTPSLLRDGGSLNYPGFGDYLYALRGYTWSSDTYSTDFWRYSISNNSWEQLDNLPFRIGGNSKLMYMGGDYLFALMGSSNYLLKYKLYTSGTFTSAAKNAGTNGGFGTITWTDNTDNKNSLIKIKARTANDSTMSSATIWSNASLVAKGADLSASASVSDGNSYLQYQAEFLTSDITKIPQLDDLTFNYDYYPQKQELVSSAYNTTTSGNRLMKLSWNKTLPQGTDLRFQLRTAQDSSGVPGSWGSWLGPIGTTFITNDFSAGNDYSSSSLVKLANGTAQPRKELEDFQYKQPITLDNTAGGVKSNVVVQVFLSVANDVFWAHVNSSGNDVRFFDGTQKLAYNLTSFDYAKKTASINVKIPSIAAGEVKNIYLLYGSSNAISESDAAVLTIPTEGLLDWWKFDEVSGTSAADSATGGNNGTLTNGPTWVAGKFGNAVNFDGSNDYVNVASIPSSAQATMEAWIKPSGTNYTSPQTIMAGYSPSASDLTLRYGILVANGSVGGEWCTYLSDGRYLQIVSSGLMYNAGNFPAGVWTQLLVTYDGANVKFYKDGVLVKAAAQTVSGSGDAQPFSIGRLGGYSGQYFRGAIDSVKIYTRALSQAEISALYQGPSGITVTISQNASVEEAITSPLLGANWPYRRKVTVANPSGDNLSAHQVGVDLNSIFPETNGLVGSWHFSEGSGTTASDKSGQSNDGNITGAAWTASGKFGNALQFDGVDDYVLLPNNPSITLSSAQDFTVSFWINASAANVGKMAGIIDFRTSLLRGIGFEMTEYGVVQFKMRTDAGASVLQTTDDIRNIWTMLTGTYIASANKMYFYQNGVLLGENTGITVALPLLDIKIGSNAIISGVAEYLNGMIDEVRIYNRALSAEEILNQYNAARMLIDPAELRFIWINPSNSSEQLVPHWFENGSKAWVKIPSMSAYSNQTAYVYYGNPNASSTSNFDNVFTKNYGESGLMGLWHFDEGSGTAAADSSGNGNNGTLTNSPAWQASDGGQWGSRSDVKFSTGSSLQFDGASNYVEIPNSQYGILAAYTVEAWINPNASFASGRNYVLGAAAWERFILGVLDGNLTLKHRDSAGNSQVLQYAYTFTPGVWYHIAGTFDYNSNFQKLFINGSEVASSIVSYMLGWPISYIGSGGYLGSRDSYFNGSIDDLRIYNRALSAGEIARHYIRSRYASPAASSSLSNYTETANTYSLANYYANNPVVQPIFGAFYNNDLAEFQETASKPAGSEIKYQVSPNGYRWYWWNGSAWAQVAGGYSEANTAVVINSNLAAFMSGVATSGEFFYRAYLHSDTGTAIPVLDQIRIATAASTSYYLDSTGITAINIMNNDAFNDQWFQYKAILYSSGKDTPILDDVTIEYTNALITITSPNTAVTWQIGSAQNITWTSAGLPTGDTVKISYSIDAGSTWSLIAASVTATNGTYPWTVAEDQTAQGRIKVASNSLSAVYDISDVNFTIGGIKIVSPNSGETWEIGTAHNITWTTVGTVSNQLSIEYSKDDFTTATLIADQQANDGVYSWSVPNDISNSVKIRIRDIVSPFATDTSDVNFKVQPVPQITVNVPNGGESWQVGSQHNITWAANAAVSNNLKFEYSKDDFFSDIHEINNFQIVLPGWNYSIPVTINNSTNTNNLTDYPVKISIDSTLNSFWSHVKSDGSDIRFYDYNPTTALAYWVETFDYANKSAVVWVKIPLIPASSSKTINLCYGNPSSVSLSSFDNVFPTGYAETGLVGLWHFSEGQGTITRDASGNNNNGTLNSGVSWSSSGKINNALVFDGVDDYVQLPFYLSKLQVEANGMSWGMWVKTTTNKAVLIRQDEDGSGTYERSGGMGILNGKAYYILYNGVRYIRPTSTKSVNDNAWHYVVGVFTLDNYMQIYVDGELENTLYAESPGDANYSNIRVAAGDLYNPTVKSFFNGAIDEVRVYNRPLSAEEVKAQYKRRKTTSVEPTASFGTEKGNVAAAPALPYYKVITINNSGAALTDYQFKIVLDSSDTSFWSHVKSDGGDIRIFDNALAELAYWMESFNYAVKSAVIWVKLPSVPASATKKINLYYGSPALTTVSNYDNVFTKVYGESGLAGLWHLDDGSENTVVDASGNGNNGISNGRVGLSFDGVNDYVKISNSASLDITNNQISIEAWIYPKNLTESYILSKYPGDNTISGYNFLITNSNIYFRLGDGAAGYQFSPSHGMSVNNWYHVVAVYDGSAMKIYKNGVVFPGSTAFSGNIGSNTNNVCIGDKPSGTSYPFNGNMNNVRIYNRALSETEVTAHYKGIYSNETGLVGNWLMSEGGTSQTVADTSGNGNNGTRGATSAVEGTDPAWFTGNPVWQTQDGGQWADRADVKFNTGSNLHFDGMWDYVALGNPASLNFLNTTHAITAEAWVYPTNYTGHNSDQWYILSKLSYPNQGWWLYLNNNGYVSFSTCDGTSRSVTSTEVIPLNSWSHVVGWSDGTTQKVFINGVEKASGVSSTLTDANTNTLRINTGGSNENGYYSFEGFIDEVRVNNRALSAAEIQAHYQRRKYASTVPAYTVGTEQANPVTTANFLYNKLVTINNSGNANALTDYRVQLVIGNTQDIFWGTVKSDGSDIRFYDGATELAYWIETFNYTAKNAVIWINVPSIPASSSKTIKVCYGNPTAPVASNFGSTDFEAGLKGLWHFSEGIGTTTYDMSGNSNNGALNGGVSWADSGKIGKALAFDGVNDYVDAGNASSLNLTNAFTLESWVKINSLKDYNQVLMKNDNNLNYYGYAVDATGSVIGQIKKTDPSSWETWQNLSGTLISNIAATSSGNEVNIFGRSTGNIVMQNKWNGSTWSGWQDLGGTIASDLAAISSGNEIYIFGRGTDNFIYYNRWNGSAWSGWTSLGGSMVKNVAATYLGSDVWVFAQDAANTPYYNRWNGSAWSGWVSMPATLTSNISVTVLGSEIFIFGLNSATNLLYNKWNGSSWEGWGNLLGDIGSDPSAVSFDGSVYAFVIGFEDRALWYNQWNGSAWLGWQTLGGLITSNITAVTSSESEINLFVRGSDNGAWQKKFAGVSWGEWQPLGGSWIEDYCATTLGAKVYLFARNSGNEAWTRDWSFLNMSSTTKVAAGAYYHLAFVSDGAQQKIYINGVEDASIGNYTGGIGVSAASLNIGWDAVSSGGYFNGNIDEVKIYNRALSAAEIQAHNQNSVPEAIPTLEESNNTGVFTWNIPDDVSGTVKVRITDNNRPTCTDKSDNNFSITQPTLTVTSPNGGEVWVNGDTQNITWTTSGQVSNTLKFEYSKDNFVSDVHLINSLWPYYQTITIDNSGNTKVLTDYQVKVVFNNTDTSFWSGVRSDGSDIRFYDGATELSYWIETFDYANKSAVLWVKVPSVPASSLKTITLKSGASGGGSNFSNTFTKNPEGTISTSGLVGNWLMNESSGTTAADSSGTGNTGTLYNYPAHPTGLSFDGVNDYVDCGNGASLYSNTGTIEVWVKPSQVGDAAIVGFNLANDNSNNNVLMIEQHSDNTVGAVLRFNAEVYPYHWLFYTPTNGILLQPNTWIHIVLVQDGTAPKLYLNGLFQVTATLGNNLSSWSNVLSPHHFFISYRDNNPYFSGSIDEVRIYNRALTAGEITNNYNGNVVRDASLVMEQRMGEGSGTTLNDNSGNNNNGTISGAAWVSSDRKFARGHIGNYFEFDGKNDYIQIPDTGTLEGMNSLTVSAWVKSNSAALASGTGIVTKWTQGTGGVYALRTAASGIVASITVLPGGAGNVNTTPTGWSGYSDLAWHYLVMRYDGSNLGLYVDGVLFSEKTGISGALDSDTRNVIIGAMTNGYYFNGSIDDVKIYNRALSAQEISEQYEIGRGLVGAWHFDEASGTTAADSSGQGNTGTLVNGPIWDAADGGQWAGRSDVKFNSGSALQFDGVDDYVDCGNTSSLDLQSQSITIEGWFYSSDWNGQADWASPVEKIYQGGSPEQRKGYGYWISSSKQVLFILFRFDGTNWGNIQQSFGIPSNNTWNHLVGVYNYSSGMMYAYKNGVLINSANVGVYNWNAGTEVPLNIGRRANGYRYFNGKIDEVRIYNRALTAGEIQAHYQRRKPTLPEPAISSLAVASQDGLLSNSYPWVIPNDPSSTVKVRITDNARPAVTDTSDNNFQILGYSSIVLTSPNGNETLIMGDSHNITWTSYGAGVSNDLKLEYSTNNGAAWALIADQQANDGTYSWTVPNIETTQGLVRITDNADALITDTSAAVFAIILPTISITSPNGGESWYATGAYDITWASVGSVSNNLKLEYTLNGTSWTQIATALADSGTYAWTVPDSASLTCKVRITDNTRLTVTDTSNADFSIVAPTITLTSPNGAEEWVAGTAHDITWTSVGTNNSIKNNLTIQYSKDNFATPIAIAAGEVNDGVRAWTIPDDVSATVKVKIFDASRPATQDTSNANFSITQPYVRVTAPNGGESWVIGTAHNITWVSLGAISNNLTIEYSKNNFATPIAISTAEANDGTFAWTIPDDVSATVKVRITDASRPAAMDMSDGSFVIANSILTVTRPNGAELFTDGDTENITWTSTGTVSNNLKLDYSKDNFATAGILIATGLSNSGTYPWTVPGDISATVRVRITDTVRPAVWDKSNAGFTILPIPQLTISSPNGGETWRVGSIYTISWSDNGGVVSNNLTVQYSIDGANWIGISTGEANDGSYSWTIPDNVSVSASVRVYDASRPSNSDVSDLAFSIALPLINITSPNGGETYAVGDAPVITWTTEGAVSENLTLEYTTDGAIFNLITSAQANTGSYAWTIPDFVSTSVKIRITDGNRPAVSGLSNSNFTVIQYPTVTVTVPNGGEVYTIGDTLPITWSYQGLNINPLTLSYSADNFVTSGVIATGVVHTARSYNWTIPDNALAGNTLKLKIYDPTRTMISDTSNSNFRIKGGFTITAPVADAKFIAKKPETISWANRGVAANVKLEYSIDSGANWNTIVASLSNTGSYTWTTANNRTAGYTAQIRVSDVTDPTINAVSGLFKIDYYTISWRVLDYDTNAPLQLLSVKDTFWSDQTNTLTSPLDHDYPYGAYTTFWSKEGYIERAMEWTADGDKMITVTLENQITAAVEWHVLLSSSYSADTDILKVSTWLERRGKLVGTTATDLTDLQSATVEVFDGTTALKSMTVNTHDTQGVFWFNWDSTGLAAGKTYFVRSSITYRSSTYTSGSAVDVTAAKKQLEDKIQMQAIQTQVDTTRAAVDTRTAEIKTKLDDTKASVETKVAEVKGETTKILAATEQTLPAKIEEARAEVETTRKSEILNRENTVRTGQALNIRFRTYPGLSPALDVYNKDNVLKIDKAAMKEVGATGIYEYEVKFVSNWGKGDFTIVCSESTKGTMDALIVTVLSTDVEEISGQVSAVLGTTSGLSDVKSLAESLNSQFNIIETSLAKVGDDLVKEVKDAVSSVSSLESIYTQLSNVAKEVKNISGEAGINLQKLYEISSDKKQDINYLKNKTQQLKAAMALNQKTVDNIANKPLTQTWYEYK